MQYNPTETYLQEAEELLVEIEHCALLLDSGELTQETVNELFRAFHTIKGSGAMFHLDAIAGFTHHVEDLLGKVRDGAIPISPTLAEFVLRANIFNLILLPGFSTARQVTSVSGRGVGMDAVKRQIDALRGSLALTS